MGTFPAVTSSPAIHSTRASVLAVTSNKGGVGKTTVATNLAIYLRALREDVPVLLVGLDDQHSIDRMFGLRPLRSGEGHLKHGWAERDFRRVVQLGQYGVHYVPSPPDTALLKARAEDPRTLQRILDRTAWQGIVILDTKSDLEALTLNALHAADRIIIPVADWASLEEARKTFAMLDKARLGSDRARLLFTLVDRRTRVAEGVPLVQNLVAEASALGWPCYKTTLSRSPKVETLNSATREPLSILHHARGSAVHAQMRDLASEVLLDLGLASTAPSSVTAAVAAGAASLEAVGREAEADTPETWTEGLLSAWRRRR
jgi:cellulose biosynthesis protein BcsQ